MALNCAIVAGTYFASEAAISAMREQKDVWNHAGAGALSGGLLARAFGKHPRYISSTRRRCLICFSFAVGGPHQVGKGAVIFGLDWVDVGRVRVIFRGNVSV